MTDLDSLMADLLAGHGGEPFDLGAVAAHVRAAFPRARPMEVRWMTLELIRHLLVTGAAQALTKTADGGQRLRPWSLAPSQLMPRLAAAWDELGREPRSGEIAWFAKVERIEAPVIPPEDELWAINA
ncbi:MAG TPA: hypothetical protein VF590_09830 [Isosphaeraceae bacterium]